MSNLYEIDFYAWTQEQAELLRQQEWQKLDLANLIEEVESLGKQQRQELRNSLSILIGHLLKWEYQRERRSRSWLATIRVQRRDILRLMRDNSSLKPYLLEILPEVYENGKDLAVMETNLPYKTFPSVCGYVWEDILSDRFFPGEPSIELEEEF
ncbi:DUF29 domain-containing protein [Aerosakkonemataceae cyanobacterium BLCC-F50]|uniref:DUF29 domain-containing protein n=1 Tax=Floridaenema flaviceps BLCC-F50 TaxID=3153642 RepID=A0ABV4Y5N8_9CYAN